MKIINDTHEFLESFRRGSEFFEPLLETRRAPSDPRLRAIAERLDRLESQLGSVSLLETRAPHQARGPIFTAADFVESLRR